MFEIKIVEETLNHETVKTVNARDLHAGLDVGRDFNTWIKTRIKKYGFTQGVDFIELPRLGENKNRTDYHITLDMAKELSMVEKTDKGKEARKYFIKMEKQAMSQLPVVTASDQVLLAQIELEKLKLIQSTELAKEKTKQLEIEAKVKLGKKKTNIRRLSDCGVEGYVTMKSIVRQLEDGNTPIAVSALVQFLRAYSQDVSIRANCINEKQFFRMLEKAVGGAKPDGAYWLDAESGTRFKADWLTNVRGY